MYLLATVTCLLQYLTYYGNLPVTVPCLLPCLLRYVVLHTDGTECGSYGSQAALSINIFAFRKSSCAVGSPQSC
ncbi:hypothetical protein Pla52n_35610 [Stieleria varia]|uniref:Uncharacterized protein n=1 Tax=Stieleria varia TaxID=2528005 RepID=A0A5C6ASR1_9BACT|nr:hypothetical protein Pla52n_35610 [Stieleria varia]